MTDLATGFQTSTLTHALIWCMLGIQLLADPSKRRVEALALWRDCAEAVQSRDASGANFRAYLDAYDQEILFRIRARYLPARSQTLSRAGSRWFRVLTHIKSTLRLEASRQRFSQRIAQTIQVAAKQVERKFHEVTVASEKEKKDEKNDVKAKVEALQLPLAAAFGHTKEAAKGEAYLELMLADDADKENERIDRERTNLLHYFLHPPELTQHRTLLEFLLCLAPCELNEHREVPTTQFRKYTHLRVIVFK